MKTKNTVSQCMVKSADDKFYPEIQNKNQDVKITIMRTHKAASEIKWVFSQRSAGATNDAMWTTMKYQVTVLSQ